MSLADILSGRRLPRPVSSSGRTGLTLASLASLCSFGTGVVLVYQGTLDVPTLSLLLACMALGVWAILYGYQGLREIRRSGGIIRGVRLARAAVLAGLVGPPVCGLVGSLSAFFVHGAVVEHQVHKTAEHDLAKIGVAFHDYHDVHMRFPQPVDRRWP
jgi:hypothetical protein